MFRVLRLMAGNLSKGPATIPFPGQVPAPDLFRGAVRLEPSRCLACGMCAYVCVSRAITGEDRTGEYHWSYDPGRCTFCARCADRCPGEALSMEPIPLDPYRQQGGLAREVAVPLPVCPDCGQPVRNTPEAWLHAAFGQVDERTRELARLCVRCRRRRLQRGMKASRGEEA